MKKMKPKVYGLAPALQAPIIDPGALIYQVSDRHLRETATAPGSYVLPNGHDAGMYFNVK
jgi:hypothetical protein